MTKKGWIDERIAIQWLRKIFPPLNALEEPSEGRFLLIDRHHTHTTIGFMWECFLNQVYVVTVQYLFTARR